MIWRFALHLKGLESFTDEQAEALYGGGCSNGTLSSSDGHARIGFDREAPSLQDAIASRSKPGNWPRNCRAQAVEPPRQTRWRVIPRFGVHSHPARPYNAGVKQMD